MSVFREAIYGVRFDDESKEGVIERREQIVRCRDCKFGAYEGNECMRVDEWDGSLWFPVEPNGFCAWGERREAE